MLDLDALSMTDIIRLQNQLQQALTRRFERRLALMFSDIVESTAFFAQHGDAAGRQLQQLHLDLLTDSVQQAQGRVVDVAGDGAFCAFQQADQAVQALIAFQQAVAQANAGRARNHQLLLRTGLHFGPVLSDGNTVSGDAVNLCARVAASAQPGETRLTRGTFQELPLAHRLNCRSLGTLALKGQPGPTELLALDWRDHELFPRRLHISPTDTWLELPQRDIVSVGRLAEHDGQPANDLVLNHPDPDSARQISRWHFELRRGGDGLRLRALSDNATMVDGRMVPRGTEVPVRAGCTVDVAGVLTLRLVAGRGNRLQGEIDPTTMLRPLPAAGHQGGTPAA